MNCTIIQNNCLKVLHTLEDNSVDLIATDPPYEINYQKNDWDAKVLNWEFLANEFFRILKPTGNLILFQGWTNVTETKECFEKLFTLKNWIIYDRIKGRGAKTNVVSTREDILWFIKSSDYTYTKIYSNIKKKTGGSIGTKNKQENRALSNVWTDISPIVPWSKERVKHPTQKPVALMERVVTIWSNPEDIVLDPFMGSGSTGVASLNLGRNFIGIELDNDYVQIAEKRLLKNLYVEASEVE